MSFRRLLLCLTFSQGCMALGINCRQSSNCNNLGGTPVKSIVDAMQSAVAAGHGNDMYEASYGNRAPASPNTHVACQCEGGGSSGICAFYQNDNYAQFSLANATALAKQIEDHGCTKCGSTPFDGNDVKNGELTINYINDVDCCQQDINQGKALVCPPLPQSSVCPAPHRPTPTSTTPTSTPVACSTLPVKPTETAPANYGANFVSILYHNGGCGSNQIPYAAAWSDVVPCYNLNLTEPWDSLVLSKHNGLQVMFYKEQDCKVDPNERIPCAIYPFATDGYCANVGGATGEFPARSMAIVRTPYAKSSGPQDVPGYCAYDGTENGPPCIITS